MLGRYRLPVGVHLNQAPCDRLPKITKSVQLIRTSSRGMFVVKNDYI